MWSVIIPSILGSGALAALISGLFSILSNRQKETKGIAKAVQLTLYNDIENLIDKAVARGSITQEEMRHLLDMFDCYHNDLEGNGFLDKKMELAAELPMKG